MLNKYHFFLATKQVKLQEMQRYLQCLLQNVAMAKKYLDEHKQIADSIIDKCPRVKKTLSDNPKIRTKSIPKSQAFFRRKELV